MLAGMEQSGVLGIEHEALVEAGRSLAAAVDLAPSNASLWREYRGVLASLMEVAAGVVDDGAAAFGDAVRTPLGDTAKS
jgi:hypothetical protein